MFRDKEEELARLEEELLEEEIPEEELLEEEEEEIFYEEPSGDTAEYHNFANDYGHVHAYNADTADVDLEEYSDEVYHEPPASRQTGLLLVVMLLLFGIFCIVGWWFLRYRGIIG